MKDRDGKGVVRSACGTKLNEIGVLRITRGGEPLDPEKIYTLASYTYTALDQGDGYTMFDGAAHLLLSPLPEENQPSVHWL
ncbi:MAG: 5'-nucleotidase C-terminal domain-containing protein [Oscillospiraceae bacterium]|nr:5'-nucleotidase C-terminal domain-containing protein [Oscillospiraceae bacterium]